MASVSILDRAIQCVVCAIIGLVVYGIANFVYLDTEVSNNPLADVVKGSYASRGDQKQQDVVEASEASFIKERFVNADGVVVVVSDYKYLNMAKAVKACDNYGEGIKAAQYQQFQMKLELVCQPDASPKDVERCKQGLKAIKEMCPEPDTEFNFFGFSLG